MRVSVRSACWTSSSVSRRYVAPGVFLSPKSGRRYHTSAYMERPYRFQSIRVGRLFQYYGIAQVSAQLGFQDPLDHPFRQLLQQAMLPEDVLRAGTVFEQFV